MPRPISMLANRFAFSSKTLHVISLRYGSNLDGCISSNSFHEVLLVSGDSVKIGQPTVAGAKVTGKVLEQGKGAKIRIFKYKAKSNYRRRQGHRQPFTKVQIEKIEG